MAQQRAQQIIGHFTSAILTTCQDFELKIPQAVALDPRATVAFSSKAKLTKVAHRYS
jgi:hypothetical protein